MREKDDLNEVMLTGRITRQPDFRKTPSGAPVLDFYLACNRYIQEEEGSEDEQLTTFIKVSAWNGRALRLKDKLQIGDEVLVRGQLVDDNFVHNDQMTTGRLKVDNLTIVKIIHKKGREETE